MNGDSGSQALENTAIDYACELTEVQAATIRVAMLDHNASCSYNMTLAAILNGV